MNPFVEKLAGKLSEGKRLCVGLDPVVEKLPPGVDVVDFCKEIVRATVKVAAVYKPNIAFFEALGLNGMSLLRTVIVEIHLNDPTMPVIVDSKRADIGATNKAYVEALFNQLGADAITLHPYLGWDQGLDVFLGNKDCFGYVLCRTTNPGARDLQDLLCEVKDFIPTGSTRPEIGSRDLAPLYQLVAYKATHEWNANNNCGLVAGATFPEELFKVRTIAPDLPLLIPGVGKQGGSLEQAVAAAFNPKIPADFVINVSSFVSEAWKSEQFVADSNDFASAAGKAATFYHEQIQVAIEKTEKDLQHEQGLRRLGEMA